MKYKNILFDWVSAAQAYISQLIFGDNLKKKKDTEEYVISELADEEKKIMTFMKETPGLYGCFVKIEQRYLQYCI
jgi:hypothetical protein